MIANFKKIVITEISTLYPALLISVKIGKLGGLLFTGSEEDIVNKVLVLLLKKDVRKKFVVMVRMIMDCDAS